MAGLSAASYFVLNRLTRSWFEKDLRLRTDLAVSSARRSLTEAIRVEPSKLAFVLDDITHDERIMGAAACGLSGQTLAHTNAFPSEFSCTAVVARIRREGAEGNDYWSMVSAMPLGDVHLGAARLVDGEESLGWILLVHDLSSWSRRENTTGGILIGALFILALAAAVVTIFAARFSKRDWLVDLQRALAGDEPGEFQPLVRDVRALADRLASERETEVRAGPWNAERLRSALRHHLHGERIVVLANREPYIHQRLGSEITVQHPASGLVTALEPIMRACSGVWVAHGSGSADRETVDVKNHVRVPPGEESYVLRRVWLSEEEEDGYYYGFSNEGLWPLCHLAHARPIFGARDWEQYVSVNERFAEAVSEEVDSDDPIVLVQDYHFALAPRMIRKRLPRATILTFWHVPWPNAERIGICPWREELISGMLGSSILGFHTQQHCNNFIDSVDAFMESRIDRETRAVVQGSRRTLVRPYPISIEWPVRWVETQASVAECRMSVRRDLGLPADTLLGVGVDRLDYTKGVEERLAAVDELLTRHEGFRGRFVFVQLAAPSRTKIDRYRELNERVESLTTSINRKWGHEGYQPIVLLRSHHEPSSVFRYYRAADVCYVSSLHDGMNLVAKEFVAARDDEQGVLVLSQFTGAARELTEALIVNPYDLQQASEALAVALNMPAAEQRERMRSMRRLLAEFNVYRWAGRMLVDAAELRRRERMVGRLSAFRVT